MKSDSKVISRIELAWKVLEVLGNLGAYAHLMIENHESTKLKEIKWDPVKWVIFAIPLYNQKVDVCLDPILPRVIEMASTSSD